ncbi:unnamed protein product [Heterobilharzia americana]|nr:unnamed protein product [Heterobilharzia americana]
MLGKLVKSETKYSCLASLGMLFVSQRKGESFEEIFLVRHASRSFADDATILSEDDQALPLASVANENDAYKGSPLVSAIMAFSKPAYGLYSGRREINLPVGKTSSVVASLVNTNPINGEQHFTLDFIEGALHYPILELASRSFDLSVVVYYHDNNNVYYAHKLINQTVNVSPSCSYAPITISSYMRSKKV